MIKVLICDDQDLVCEGLKGILSTDPELKLVGVAKDGAEALEIIPACQPDLVLMDLKMPVMNGVQATRQIRREHPRIEVLVLTTYDADEWVFDAIRAGARGYLLKDTPRQRLLAAIKEAAAGKTPVDPAVAGRLFAHVTQQTAAPDTTITSQLSEREKEVLGLLGKGLSNAEIAARIYLSEGTVRNYVSSIFEKLGVEDRTQAAILAIRCGLTNLSEP
ncbi:MAG TPA: response regulator transcription factor [Anaerolineales bacterium]|nr:response regulator transcription factor [Anaerolineales bacterium]